MYSSCIEKQKYSVIPSLLLSFTGTVSFPTVYSFSLVASTGTPGVYSSVDGTWYYRHLWGLRLGHCAHSFHSHFFPHF